MEERKMKSFLLRTVLYVGMFVLFMGVIGFSGYTQSFKSFYGSVYKGSFPAFDKDKIAIPEHSPENQLQPSC